MSKLGQRIAIVTDSTSDLPAEVVSESNISIVPLYVLWGQDAFRDGIDITKEAFYERLGRDPEIPRTSQPTPADFLKAYRRAIADGAEEIVVFTIARALSGTYDSAMAAAAQVQVPVHVVDSCSVSMGLGLQVMAAQVARKAGGDVAAVLEAAERVRQRLRVFFAVKSLEYLHRGGRIGGAARFLGTMLRLKPVLMLNCETGRIEAVEQVRAWKRATRRVCELASEGIEQGRKVGAWVMHAMEPDSAKALAERLVQEYTPAPMGMGLLSVVLGTHAGPGMVGMAMYLDED